jgi:precorrin-3B synthase
MDGVSRRRRGFCPSPWSPMMSGDGLLVRVRTASRALSTAELRTLCELASAHGNGQIELTRRANLQLRGIAQSRLTALQNALLSRGLLAPTPELEQSLGLLVSPLAGLDPRCDGLAELAHAIEGALLAEPSLPVTPSKFAIVLDAEAGVLAEVFADLRVECGPQHAHVYVAGDRDSAHWLGACRTQHVPVAVVRLLRSYAELGADARHDAPAWLAAAGSQQLRAQLADWLLPAPRPAAAGSSSSTSAVFIGRNADWFGLGVPFGSATAETWHALARLADELGRGQIRMTPWRSVLIPGCRDAALLEHQAAQLGLICRPGDPLERVDACPGAPACASALGETRQLARALAPMLEPGARLHVSGCSKGCAHRGTAEVTLLPDTGGCRIGFDLDSAGTSAGTVVPLSEARAQLSAWRVKRAMNTQA